MAEPKVTAQKLEGAGVYPRPLIAPGFGEAAHRVGRCPWGQARPSSLARATNARLLWYSPAPGGVLDSEGVDGLVEHGLQV